MTTISPTATIADLVLEAPGRARVFEQLGLDYCCGGSKSLADACERRGLDLDAVLTALDVPAGPGTGDDVGRLTVAELCDHIVATHHARLRTELPRLSTLWEKVARAHGKERKELIEVRALYELLRVELEQHCVEEEATLFPACRRFGEMGAVDDALLDELPGLEGDHAAAGTLLQRISELTGDYDLDRAMCNTHRAAVDALRELQADLHVHIHEENNVLFTRVREAAAA
jgi:regulator of cell morphogenesis and NO signaling